MDSIWEKTAEPPRFNQLEGDLRTDVLIVGGGLAGLLCAHKLARAGVDCALVEASRICGGTTKGMTGKLTAQHGLIYHKLLRRFGAEGARLYLTANLEALDEYRALCREMDCGFAEEDNYVYSLDSREKLERELSALDQLGFAAQLVDKTPLPFPVAGAVRFPRQARFHPLKFAAAIARSLRIFEDTKVLELAPGRARTSRGTIAAERIVIATHFPILNKHGGYFLKLYQDRSYLLALENAPELDGMYVDEAEGGLTFRNGGGLLLLGGGGGRTGKPAGGWGMLEDFARRHYPQARVAARWAAQDCMSLDGVPYAGRCGGRTRGLYVITGFNKWGNTSAMAAAGVLADLLQGRENPYAALFDPARTVLRPQLLANGLEAVLNLLRPTAPRCPHMGCALRWNGAERSWDCPCHGSRFGADGTLLNNPASSGKPGLQPPVPQQYSQHT
mgnify:FL=1